MNKDVYNKGLDCTENAKWTDDCSLLRNEKSFMCIIAYTARWLDVWVLQHVQRYTAAAVAAATGGWRRWRLVRGCPMNTQIALSGRVTCVHAGLHAHVSSFITSTALRPLNGRLCYYVHNKKYGRAGHNATAANRQQQSASRLLADYSTCLAWNKWVIAGSWSKTFWKLSKVIHLISPQMVDNKQYEKKDKNKQK